MYGNLRRNGLRSTSRATPRKPERRPRISRSTPRVGHSGPRWRFRPPSSHKDGPFLIELWTFHLFACRRSVRVWNAEPERRPNSRHCGLKSSTGGPWRSCGPSTDRTCVSTFASASLASSVRPRWRRSITANVKQRTVRPARPAAASTPTAAFLACSGSPTGCEYRIRPGDPSAAVTSEAENVARAAAVLATADRAASGSCC